MKKLIALLLTMMLLLPAVSLGESETYTVDFDDFILTVSSDDIIQKGQKTEGGVVFMLYPAYDETAVSHPNISSAWTAESLEGIDDATAPLFGAQVLQSIVDGLSAQNIAVTNDQLLDAQFDEETGSLTLAFAWMPIIPAWAWMCSLPCTWCRSTFPWARRAPTSSPSPMIQWKAPMQCSPTWATIFPSRSKPSFLSGPVVVRPA